MIEVYKIVCGQVYAVSVSKSLCYFSFHRLTHPEAPVWAARHLRRHVEWASLENVYYATISGC